ncbi:hypothetical protein GCM10022197_05170 [Microlunatus spumicola]|uniref:histidine kinase n=1 Tax=Microlunatus spumicola TaxID=81499 RepID=A0ABP6WN71_9ACTN
MSGGGGETHGELAASRARVLARADAERSALQRELHDGAQQRLVHALIALRLARSALGPGSPGAALVDEALTNVEQANRDLRALVHRVLPASLVHGGLASALRSLVDDLAVPVALHVDVPRLRPEDETTAYVVAAEVLRTVTARSDAREVDADVRLDGDRLTIDVWLTRTPLDADRTEPSDPPRDGVDLAEARDRTRTTGGSLTVTDLGPGRAVVRAVLLVRARREPDPNDGVGRA